MAGVPLLNGFLSKEMFFAETVVDRRRSPLVESALPLRRDAGRRLQRRLFAALHPRRVLRPAADATCRAAARAAALDARCRSRCWCWPAWWSASLPGAVGRPVPGRRRRVPVARRARLPAYSLAVWHGFTPPLLMSLIALAGGVAALPRAAAAPRAAALDGAPLIRRLDGRRLFERTLVVLSWRWRARARAAARHAPPAAAAAAGAVRGRAARRPGRSALRGLAAGRPRALPASIPCFALLWAVGAACALGAAWQAKFHRLAALMLLGGAGLVACLTFVWFSAPDLALTQLLVEVVTTVLLLLGLRWLPKRVERRRTPRDRRDHARRGACATSCIAVAAGAGLAALAYARDDAAAAPQSISPLLPRARLPKAAAPTSST